MVMASAKSSQQVMEIHQTQMAAVAAAAGVVMNPAACCGAVAAAAAVLPQHLAGQSGQQTARGCSCNLAAQGLIGLLLRPWWQQVAWPKRWMVLNA
jgi:hypothetical protein